MKTETIKQVSVSLAKEIASRSSFDVKETATLIYVNFKSALSAILRENTNEMNAEYIRLLEQQQNYGMGTPMYHQISAKLAVLKQKRAVANSIENNTKKKETITLLKKQKNSFVNKLYSIYGEDAIKQIEKEFFEEITNG